ncbi:RHS repeat domain-containing protein [Flavobacterium sp. I3-2]|uniref:RHS repeat domain-containing protein n=1 Tax=Flavobacterium sp. I3-2 TaxID=2748319 RepID=UPI0015B26B0D|nr:RHS repeat domain-containing protein [Flavobacterium sp. I3-2]
MRKHLIKSLISINFLCFWGNIIKAQDYGYDSRNYINKFSISTPDVSNFEKYSISEVNKYVGAPQINIPIYTIKSGGIEYPISLSYDTRGVKVDQIASNVGLGWNLTKTIISRIINEHNDFNNLGAKVYETSYVYESEEKQHDFKALLEGSVFAGYFLTKKNQSIKMGSSDMLNVDFLPDTYRVYSPNFKTSFFFENTDNPIELEPQGTLIKGTVGKKKFRSYIKGFYQNAPEFYNFPTQDFFSFSIIDNKGIKYLFNDYDVSVDYTQNALNKYYLPPQVSAWHVSEIEDLNTGKKIYFEYNDYSTNTLALDNIDLRRNATRKSYKYTKAAPVTSGSQNCYYYSVDDTNGRYTLDETEHIDVSLKAVKKIVFDEGYVVFRYNNEDENGMNGRARKDVFGGLFLTKILIYNKNNEVVNYFDLNYSYFQSDYGVGEFNPYPSTEIELRDYRYKRLKLDSVKPMGLPAYEFYYDITHLPPLNSFAIDFLGYANGSLDVENIQTLTSQKLSPKLYYRSNQFEKSLLPFYTSVSGQNTNVIPGYFNREATSKTKGWSLTKVKFPTGGTLDLDYELNTFDVDGNTIAGGGIRVKQQKLNDGFGNIRTVNYFYVNKDDNKTSGTLSSYPFFGHPSKKFFDVYRFQETGNEKNDFDALGNSSTNVTDWILFDKSNMNEDITSGSYVGYSRVLEKEIGSGFTEYLFTSNNNQNYRDELERNLRWNPSQTSLGSNIYTCLSDFLIMNSGIGSRIFTDNSYLRGKLLEQNLYSDTNKLLHKTQIEYQIVTKNLYSFLQPVNQGTHSSGVKHLMSVNKTYKASAFLPKSKNILHYDTSDVSNIFSEMSWFYYNEDNVLRTVLGEQNNRNSKSTKFYYAKNVTSTNSLPGETISSSDLNVINLMKSSNYNNIATPIQVDEIKDDDYLVSRNRVLFKQNGNHIVPSKISNVLTDEGQLTNVATFDKYDNKSNLLEMTKKVDDKTIYIWGYYDQKIVAEIKNFSSYDNIPQNLITDIKNASNSNNEQSIINALNALRNHNSMKDASVTTYTHKPLVGVTSIIGPNGLKTTYEYDEFNRLKLVRDHLGNIISKNEYNYKNL